MSTNIVQQSYREYGQMQVPSCEASRASVAGRASPRASVAAGGQWSPRGYQACGARQCGHVTVVETGATNR
jgi:hypothetical protein